MNSIRNRDFVELHTVHQHQPHCKQACFVFTDITDIELPPHITKFSEKIRNGSIQSYKKECENIESPQEKTSKSKKVIIIISCLLVCMAMAGGIPLGLQLRSSSLLEARLTFIQRLLTESPLVEGYWNPEIGINFTKSVNEVKENMIGAVLLPIKVPCGAQYLDAVQLALEGIDEVKNNIKKIKILEMVETADEMESSHMQNKIALLLGLDGGHALGASLGVLRSMYILGIRFVSLTSLGCTTPWATSAAKQEHFIEENSTNTLTEFGETILHEMNRLGMLAEISRLSEPAMILAMHNAKAPVLFFNASPLSLCNSSGLASVPDHIISLLPQNGGVIMLNMEKCGNHELNVKDAIKSINHVRAIAGVDHVGLSGSPHSYQFLLAELARDRVWGNAAIKKLIGGNISRVLREVEILKNRLPLYEEWIPRSLIEGSSYCRYSEI